MLLIPLATFYFSWIFLFNSSREMLGWSGLLAVIATNCVIVSYVVMAWNEEDPEKEGKDGKKDKKQSKGNEKNKSATQTTAPPAPLKTD